MTAASPAPRCDRPALQALLAEVRDRKIDVVVVYKVDRLTRSLADFAKLIELFDAHAVSFVSVTQSFNTSTSMGRLTLNILLSFAQFEREVIGERVRDKIAASKRKGIWVGGPVPLGYAAVAKKARRGAGRGRDGPHHLCPLPGAWLGAGAGSRTSTAAASAPGNAGSPMAAASAAAPSGWAALRICSATGSTSARWSIAAKHFGAITRRSSIAALFAAVQAKLSAQAVERRCRVRGSPALLAGRLFDEQGHRMTPTHTNKKGVRYRYYVSQAVLRQRSAGPLRRVPAPELEATVVGAIRRHLQANGTDPRHGLPLPPDAMVIVFGFALA